MLSSIHTSTCGCWDAPPALLSPLTVAAAETMGLLPSFPGIMASLLQEQMVASLQPVCSCARSYETFFKTDPALWLGSFPHVHGYRG